MALVEALDVEKPLQHWGVGHRGPDGPPEHRHAASSAPLMRSSAAELAPQEVPELINLDATQLGDLAATQPDHPSTQSLNIPATQPDYLPTQQLDNPEPARRAKRSAKQQHDSPIVDLTADEDTPQPARVAQHSAAAAPAVDLTAATLDTAQASLPPLKKARQARSEAEEDLIMLEPVDLASSQLEEDRLQLPQQEVPPTLPEADPAGSFACAVCYDEHPMQDCFIASMCRHMLCRDAARGVVLAAIQSCTFPILCPICQAQGDPACAQCARRLASLAPAGEGGGGNAAPLAADWCCSLDADVTLLLSVEEEEQYQQRSVKAATARTAGLVPCPQANCAGVAVAGGKDDSPRLVCGVCEHEWCKTCKVAWHSGKSCDEHQREVGEAQADEGMREYEANNRLVHCPTCGHGIEKISGCNHVVCSGCREHVCFACGKKMPRANPYSHFHGGRCSQSSPAPRTAAGGEAGGAAGVQGLAQLAVALAAADRARAAANAAMQAAQLGGMGLPGYAVDADFHAGMGLPDMDMLQPPHGLPPNAPLYDAAAAAAHVPRRMRGRRRRRY